MFEIESEPVSLLVYLKPQCKDRLMDVQTWPLQEGGHTPDGQSWLDWNGKMGKQQTKDITLKKITHFNKKP